MVWHKNFWNIIELLKTKMIDLVLDDRTVFVKRGLYEKSNNGWGSIRDGTWGVKRSDCSGFKLRMVGILFTLVGSSLFFACLKTGILVFQLFPLIFVIVGIWLLLIGLGKVEFYDLRPDIAVKVIFGIIIGSWLLVFLLMFLEFKGVINLTIGSMN